MSTIEIQCAECHWYWIDEPDMIPPSKPFVCPVCKRDTGHIGADDDMLEPIWTVDSSTAEEKP